MFNLRIFPRSTKKLLQVLKNNMHQYRNFGLCTLTLQLRLIDIISRREHIKLNNFIHKNRPLPGSKHYDESMKGSDFFWERNNRQARIDWLEDMINSRHKFWWFQKKFLHKKQEIMNFFRQLFPRRTKKLLIILRENLPDTQCRGLCLISRHLCKTGQITDDEYYKLLTFIRKNRPRKDNKHFDASMEHCLHFWPLFALEPRKAWLDDMINSL